MWPIMMPGLPQTPAYAEASIVGGRHYIEPERVARLVKVRAGRQVKIDEGGASYTVILWEGVLRHSLVPVGIHREQLAAIVEVGKRKNVTVQVLPFSAGVLAGVIPAFSSFSFDEELTVEAVTLENLRGTSVLEGSKDLVAYANAGQEGNCVEVAETATHGRAVRDSKQADGPLLAVSRESWRDFLQQF